MIHHYDTHAGRVVFTDIENVHYSLQGWVNGTTVGIEMTEKGHPEMFSKIYMDRQMLRAMLDILDHEDSQGS